ncbi:MAG: WcaI family glycosyltransferase [Bacteroidia bacterium]|nr:WcaI family glycosyltransferase [Bacteroidia bacterium]MBT8279227.1 WcaI family glycosyltransferase [Bacteroidia bacterium]NND25707.1 WcaI family glycosyltransferase [Flavobacteriaceae bacterium]NNK59763.1 WcaI family glycosyltransferase [Flavobacteriaceae bacterium]RZW56038.1 MAG: colanic acid biosynthesis glycosyltransferase WcaI [Flavobacteriaceae bacterium]
MKKKNITFIGLNYAPEDTAIGLYSTQWVDFLNDNGFNVTVITAFPYYPQWKISEDYANKSTFYREERNGIKILRYKQYVPKSPSFLKRIIHLLDFTIGSFINLFKVKKCDVVIAVVPFTTSIFLGYIQKLRFKAPLWTHIQDFEFDAALQTGVGKKKNIFFSILFRIEKWVLSKSDMASTISQSMLQRLSEKTKSKQFYLPNWIDEEQINPETSDQHEYLTSDKMKILYSGNIGDKQDWEAFISFCHEIDVEKYEVIIVGNGAKKDWVVEQLTALPHVSYYEPVAYEALSSLLCSADIHVLFQKPDVVDTVMPSKVLGMMASAKPSIIIGNENSEVKTIFEDSQGGLYFTKYSSELIHELDAISRDTSRMKTMGNNARAYVIQNYSKEQTLSKMLNALKEL